MSHSSPMNQIWRFSKMHGAGNDFVVLDGVRQAIKLTPERARALANRHLGIGADQILLVEPSQHPQAHFRYRIFNASGQEVEHCGNGARCFVRFVHEQGLSTANPLIAEIAGGLIQLHDHAGQGVWVDMGPCAFTPQSVHFDCQGLPYTAIGQDTLWELPISPELGTLAISLASISNPHAVMVVRDTEHTKVEQLGPYIESHPRFAQKVNVGFMQILDLHHIRLRVYERGAGETLACGTGACAAVLVGIRQGLLQSPVQVQTRGGTLCVQWEDNKLTMSGPVATVFSGQIDIARLTASSC
ncbi:diaminopimelate epimerase [Alcaligenes endophyticus]|uniref:Diaminopimelate epimerase n=1 Tax=Alcaligenes endophyticus TaxID=1929088 RepID=A0ABT8EGB4_9BURK|nr:diaminopimelate epimerase [Alcaligenes endophyticus]MCX5590033.1 diaminopimelate epimerase [Alcaligenes endophyticus]MDN4120304.1 diaminopimelate epimerase [Alcaligenes endophyticus]